MTDFLRQGPAPVFGPACRREVSAKDLDTDPSPSTEIRAVIDCVVRDSLGPASRALLEASIYKPGSTQNAGVFPAVIDLHSDSEGTRQTLYELVVRDHFTPQASGDPEDEWVPSSTPEEAGLDVFFAQGRWFATWLKLEEPEDLPEAQRRELLVLAEDPDEPGKLIYRTA